MARYVQGKGGKWLPVDFNIRPNMRYDKAAIKSDVMGYTHLDCKDRRVLDLGAHIGGFTVLAMALGAQSVAAFEPHPDSFELLVKNTAEYGDAVDVHERAVIADYRPEVTLYGIRAGSENTLTPSLVISRGRPALTVRAVNLHHLYAESRPQVVKIDVEGYEYELLRVPMPDSVEQVAVEFMTGRKYWSMVELPAALKRFEDWDEVANEKMAPWCHMRVFRR